MKAMECHRKLKLSIPMMLRRCFHLNRGHRIVLHGNCRSNVKHNHVRGSFKSRIDDYGEPVARSCAFNSTARRICSCHGMTGYRSCCLLGSHKSLWQAKQLTNRPRLRQLKHSHYGAHMNEKHTNESKRIERSSTVINTEVMHEGCDSLVTGKFREKSLI